MRIKANGQSWRLSSYSCVCIKIARFRLRTERVADSSVLKKAKFAVIQCRCSLILKELKECFSITILSGQFFKYFIHLNNIALFQHFLQWISNNSNLIIISVCFIVISIACCVYFINWYPFTLFLFTYLIYWQL